MRVPGPGRGTAVKYRRAVTAAESRDCSGVTVVTEDEKARTGARGAVLSVG